MTGPSVKELNQNQKAQTKIHKSDQSNNQNLTLKVARAAAWDYRNHRKKG